MIRLPPQAFEAELWQRLAYEPPPPLSALAAHERRAKRIDEMLGKALEDDPAL